MLNKHRFKYITQKLFIGVCVLCAIMVTGCAITPKPIESHQIRARSKTDLAEVLAAQESPDKPISIYDAMARAIKYNLDYRVQLIEDAIVRGQLQAAKFDLLPQLTSQAGYHYRNNKNASVSHSLATGTQSLEASTSQERKYYDADIGMVWNILDFGVAFATANQQADQVLITNEKRRKAIQNIIQDVRYAYWRAVAASRSLAQMKNLIKRAELALKRSRQMENQQVQSPQEALDFQQALLETIRQLFALQKDLALAKTELATLINLKPGTPFAIKLPAEEDFVIPETKVSLETLENLALSMRPELREENYQKRISSLDVRKAMLRMLPGLEFSFSRKYDATKYLINHTWSEAGLRLSWNIFSLFSGPANIRTAKAQEKMANTRRMAMGMAVLTQLHLAIQGIDLARKDYEINKKLYAVNNRRKTLAVTAKQAQAGTEMDIIQRDAATLLARMQMDLAYADLQNAFGRIINSLGRDPLPLQIKSQDLHVLAKTIEEHLIIEAAQPQSLYIESPKPQSEPVDSPRPQSLPVDSPRPQSLPVDLPKPPENFDLLNNPKTSPTHEYKTNLNLHVNRRHKNRSAFGIVDITNIGHYTRANRVQALAANLNRQNLLIVR